MTIDEIMANLWKAYISNCPSAPRVVNLLQQCSDIPLVNDHIALRTLNHPKIAKEVLAKPLLLLGYEIKEKYQFEAKYLDAFYLAHPNPAVAKIFISELRIEDFDAPTRQLLNTISESMPPEMLGHAPMLYSGRHWHLKKAQYDDLRAQSEYAAWFALFGFGANHFTIDVDSVTQLNKLELLNQRLIEAGFMLNKEGGEIKGDATSGLMQSATIADMIRVELDDVAVQAPGCFYEFAQRFSINGERFEGFVPAQADKIFHSTDSRN